MDVGWARIRNWWENTRSGLWFIPSLLTAAALTLAVAVPEIDARLARHIDPRQRWLFSGSAGAARTLLSVIAGSLTPSTRCSSRSPC